MTLRKIKGSPTTFAKTFTRLGTLVTCNTFRQPSLLAKMAATLDVISGGRLEFGIGAGWYKREHEAYGITLPDLPTRLGWLRESVQIIRGLWTEKKFTFQGEFYRIKDAYCEPKPLQKPSPTIWIGGKSDKLLRVVAEVGDGCNFIWMTPEEYKATITILERYCEQVGKQPRGIKQSYCTDVLLASNKALLKSTFVGLKNRNVRGISMGFNAQGTTLEDYGRGRFVGTPQNCIDQIDEFIEIGVSEFMLIFPELDLFDLTYLKLFAEKVIPSFD